MSDSDDDWFSKDIDDIVQKVQKKIITNRESKPVENVDFPVREIPKLTFDSEYGGNYDIATKKSDETQSKKSTNASKAGKGYVQPISFKKLNFISELSSLNVFLEVFQNDCGYFEAFEKNLTTEFIILTVKVFAKLCELPLHEYKKQYLSIFVEKQNFLKQFSAFLNDLINETLAKKKKKLFLIDANAVLNNTLEICKNIITYSLRNVNFDKFFEQFQNCLEQSKNTKFSNIQDEMRKISNERDSQKLQVTDIYPSLEELTTNDVVVDLKPNIIKGKYESVTDYLQIHHALLREDFISPLRDEIIELKSSKNLKDIKNKRVYKKTKIFLNTSINQKTRTAEIIVVDLKSDDRDAPHQSSENSWVNPKKLMYGSLLCFTSTLDFNDLILAVVSHRDIDMLSKGYVNIEIIKMYNITSIFEKDFIMLESEVYFEPYHHVHRVLKTLDENNFPMKSFIIEIDKTNHLPDYLNGTNDTFYSHRNFTFNPIEPKTLLSTDKLKLDSSQLRAYQMALSKKFSLIQGPPGTGKTYIGLEIVATILKNIDLQVLIICYTNHALDQFLTEITKVTDDVVRMGNQSKHDVLDKYNIKQINDSIVTDRRLKACFYNTKNEYFKLMQEFEILQAKNDSSEENNKKVLGILEKVKKVSRKLDELKQISEYNFIKDKRVIGMTTTCAARCNLLLKLLKTPIVIVEEAAEVLETHIIASLTNETQHVILIGDHQQLRPSTSVYKLSQKYKMDISLFERMINNDFNCVCLETQHRMRPEIANLIRPTIYKKLEDYMTVKEYQNIKGVSKNMFFVDHDFKESKFGDETTKRNVHEAQFLIGMANYLLQQGYKPEDIILLTTYNGQMIQLLNERKQYPNLHKIRVTVVDNFQGEESKIILLSLVRSNDEKRIGYLALVNRICVSLSRAREGFYMIGNMKFLARNNTIWNSVCEELQTQNAIGECLPLQCERHKNITYIRLSSDFESVKFGGCKERCNSVFPCGHTCGYMCHSDTFDHRADCDCG